MLGSHSGAVLGAAPAEDRHGGIGGALAFNGGSDHVTVPSSEELNFGEGDFTIAFWLFLNDRHFERTGIMNKDSYQNTPDMTATGWVFNVNRGIGIETRQVMRGSGPITHARTPEESIQLKRWYHLAAVRQDRTLTLYVDGVLSAVQREGSVANLSSSAPLEFGQVSLRQQNMNGRLDDVWIFRRALTREEVVALRDC